MIQYQFYAVTELIYYTRIPSKVIVDMMFYINCSLTKKIIKLLSEIAFIKCSF